MTNQSLEQIKSRLQQTLPGSTAHELMMGRVRNMPLSVPDNARQSAVLCLLFPIHGKPHVLLMKRREDNTAHSGQVSFPGGRFENTDRDYLATALREADEEVGIKQQSVHILGALTPLYIPVSNFNVHPFLAYSTTQPSYTLSDDEVSYVLEVPLSELFNGTNKIKTVVTSPASPGVTYNVNAYQPYPDTIIWGATAMILSEIEQVLTGLSLSFE